MKSDNPKDIFHTDPVVNTKVPSISPENADTAPARELPVITLERRKIPPIVNMAIAPPMNCAQENAVVPNTDET